MITQSRLQELLHYSPDTGVFTRLVQTSSRVKIGDIAGGLNQKGYRQITIDGKKHSAHRLAWFYMTGDWPIAGIDHRNGVKDDNRWRNLREATHAENGQNMAMYRNNTSGFMGVSWDHKMQKWQASLMTNGHHKHLGRFDMPEAAHAAYLAAKADLHTFQPEVRTRNHHPAEQGAAE